MSAVAFVAAQQVDDLQPEEHPKLSWKRCSAPGVCESVPAEIVVDAEWRWIHKVEDIDTCWTWADWDYGICPDPNTCTETCALEGANYEYTYGLTTNGDTLTQPYIKYADFASSRASRVYLMENEDTYQTFTLMDNEITFDVDVSSVVCGINSALRFLEMDPDGGAAKYPTNKAGARYGTGYCDASCTRANRFVGGKANSEDWVPYEDWEGRWGGQGRYGACCPEFDVWNSNAHSYSMISKVCAKGGYQICDTNGCDSDKNENDGSFLCDDYGCDYNPFRLGATDFYGPGKDLDTNKTFTVVTRFEESAVTQFFIQGGKVIKPPPATYPDFPEMSGLSDDYCLSLPSNFNLRDRFNELGGWPLHNDALRRPMVLALQISADYEWHNLWLDSLFPPENEGQPGVARGDCPPADNAPEVVEYAGRRSKAVWSNIRFGPIGSTVDVDV